MFSYIARDIINKNEFSWFCISPLNTDSYYFWCSQFEVVLKCKELWKFVGTPYTKCTTTSEPIDENSPENKRSAAEKMIQKRNLTLPYLVKSIHPTCMAVIRKVRSLAKACKLLGTMFQAVSETFIDVMLSALQSIRLENGENMNRYSNHIFDSGSELESKRHRMFEAEKERALLRDWSQSSTSLLERLWMVRIHIMK